MTSKRRAQVLVIFANTKSNNIMMSKCGHGSSLAALPSAAINAYFGAHQSVGEHERTSQKLPQAFTHSTRNTARLGYELYFSASLSSRFYNYHNGEADNRTWDTEVHLGCYDVIV